MRRTDCENGENFIERKKHIELNAMFRDIECFTMTFVILKF